MQVPSLPTYPSPWIMKIEAYKYLLPLYERGWYISEEPLPTGQTRTWPTLKKVFRFKRRVSSAVFIKEVADTMIRLQVRSPDICLYSSTNLHVPARCNATT